jgi:glutaredoxin
MTESDLVVLYVVPGCPLCENARQMLAELRTSYVERDVANDYSALRSMYKLTRQGLVPVVEFKGKSLVRPTKEELAALTVG